MSASVTINACLTALSRGELSRYQAVLRDIIAAERRAGRYATAVWFTVLSVACDAEQLRRGNAQTALPDTEAALLVVLRSLADSQVTDLLEQYRELASADSNTPSVMALARLASRCATLLDAIVFERCASTLLPPTGAQPPPPRAGWRQERAGRPVAAAIARERGVHGVRRDAGA